MRSKIFNNRNENVKEKKYGSEKNRNRPGQFRQLVTDMGQQVRALGQEVPNVTRVVRRATRRLLEPMPLLTPSRKDPLNGERWTSLVAQKISTGRRATIIDPANLRGKDFPPLIFGGNPQLTLTLTRFGEDRAIIFAQIYNDPHSTAIVVHEDGTKPAQMLVKADKHDWRVVDPLREDIEFDPRNLYSHIKDAFVTELQVDQRSLESDIAGIRTALSTQATS